MGLDHETGVILMDYITTPTAEHLDLDADTLNPHPQNDTRIFPDGEVYVQLSSIDEMDEVVVVHSGQPHPNRGLIELYGVLDLLQEHDVPADVCFTYMPYGMQDDTFYDGTLNYSRAIIQTLVDYYDVGTVYTVDAHFSERDWIDAFPVENVHAFPLIQDRVAMDDYVVVGPDLGAVKRFGIAGFEKERTGAYDVSLSGDLDVDGKNVLVFDDIIETGGTMAAAYETLQEQGAERVEAAAVHGVLDDGVERVGVTYDALHLTNTIKSPYSTIDIEPLLEETL